MAESPDDVLEELRSVADALAGASGAEREALEARRTDLRRRARLAHLALTGPAALAAELGHLRRRLAALDGERLQVPAWQARLGRRLTDPEAAGREINRRLDEATAPERASIEERIAEIEEILGEGDEPPEVTDPRA